RDSCSITLFFAGSAPAPTVQSLLALSRATPDAVARAQREFSHGPPPRSVRWRTDRDPRWRSNVGVRKNMHLRRNLGGSETHSSHRFAGFELQLLPDADDAPTDACHLARANPRLPRACAPEQCRCRAATRERR